jgi:hypothetical protein
MAARVRSGMCVRGARLRGARREKPGACDAEGRKLKKRAAREHFHFSNYRPSIFDMSKLMVSRFELL